MKSPEIYQARIKVESTILMSRITFEQKPGKAIFMAEISSNDKKIKCKWPCNKSLDDFIKYVEVREKGIHHWEAGDGAYWSVSGEYGTAGELEYWFDPFLKGKAPNVGIQIDTRSLDWSDIDLFLEKSTKIASETLIGSVNLPSNLNEELKDFITTSL